MNDVSNPDSYTIESETIIPEAPTKEGYSFIGWFDAESDGSPITDIPQGSTGDKALWARWTANTDTRYTVKHYRQSVDGSDYILAATEYLEGTTDTAASAVPAIYAGFHENAAHSDRIPVGIITGDGNLVLKLYYDRNTYTVSFDSNEGSAVSDIENIRYEDKISAPAEPIKDGHIFLGWYKNEGFADKWSFTTDQVLADITLYAKWVDESSIRMSAEPDSVLGNVNFSMEFTLNIHNDVIDGTVDESDITLGGVLDGLIVDEVVTVSQTAVTVNFEGNLNREGSGNIVINDDVLEASNNPLTAEIEVRLCSIVYDGNGNTGGVVPADSSKYATGADVTVSGNTGSLEMTGHTFAGWNTEADGSGDSYEADDVLTMGITDITLYAEWEINTYTVIFKGWKEEVLKVETVEYGGSATAPGEPRRSGYSFRGWDKDFTDITGDLIVLAQFNKLRDNKEPEQTKEDKNNGKRAGANCRDRDSNN